MRTKGNRHLELIPCHFCTKPIDKRGLLGHERYCAANPDKQVGMKLTLLPRQGMVIKANEQEINYYIDVYRKGLRDGMAMQPTHEGTGDKVA